MFGGSGAARAPCTLPLGEPTALPAGVCFALGVLASAGACGAGVPRKPASTAGFMNGAAASFADQVMCSAAMLQPGAHLALRGSTSRVAIYMSFPCRAAGGRLLTRGVARRMADGDADPMLGCVRARARARVGWRAVRAAAGAQPASL